MATVAWTPTTSGTNLDKVWRIVQLQLQQAFNFSYPEWNVISNKISRMRINLSARQIIMPLDLNEDYGVASIPEGGWEAVPASPNVVEATLTWITLNKRFSLTRTAKQLDTGGNAAAMVMKQIRYQGMKAVQAIQRRVADYMYGFSTAVMCKINSAAGAPSYTMKDLYGKTGLGTASVFTPRIFKIGDRIAFLNPTGPALRAGIYAITNVVGDTITLSGSPTGAAANDLVVFANSVEDADITHTDYSRGLVGMLDGAETASVHSLSNSNWLPGYTDTASGRFGTVELRKGKQGIMNKGGGDLNFLLMSQGVENDIVAGLRAGVRFADAFNMEIDGAAKAKGITILSTERNPNGYVFGMDIGKSLKKLELLSGLKEPGWDEAEKIPNRAGFVFPIDWPLAMIHTNRGNFAYWSNKTEQ